MVQNVYMFKCMTGRVPQIEVWLRLLQNYIERKQLREKMALTETI